MATPEETSEFVEKFAKALRRSKKIPPNYKARLRKLQAMDSLLKVRRLNEGMVTSNDYRELLLSTVADPALPPEVRQRMKDIAVQILSPDDEIVDYRDKEMEQMLNKILSGGLDEYSLAQMYMDGTFENVMKYIERMMDRANDGMGGYDEKLLEMMTRGRNRRPGMWSPDKLVQLDFLFKNFSERFGESPGRDVVRKKLLNTLTSYGRNLERKKSSRGGPEQSDVKRPYAQGDDIDSVDFEDTLDSVAEGGDKSFIAPDDIVVRDEAGEEVTAIMLQDVSHSMFGYLGSVIPCFVLTYSALKRSRRGVCIFAGNGYPVKSVNEEIEDEKVVGAYYNLIGASIAHSLTRGTMGVAAFRWAEQQLENAGGGRKMVFLFSDCGFNELGNPLETIKRLNERGAEVVIAHPDIERTYFGWGPYGGPNMVNEFEKHGCKVLDCSVFGRFVSQLEETL